MEEVKGENKNTEVVQNSADVAKDKVDKIIKKAKEKGKITYGELAKELEGYKTKLLDTRKTTPNMRPFEKYAVTVGGGHNHRYNLSDGVMLKDNHIGAAGGIKEAVAMAKDYAPFV